MVRVRPIQLRTLRLMIGKVHGTGTGIPMFSGSAGSYPRKLCTYWVWCGMYLSELKVSWYINDGMSKRITITSMLNKEWTNYSGIHLVAGSWICSIGIERTQSRQSVPARRCSRVPSGTLAMCPLCVFRWWPRQLEAPFSPYSKFWPRGQCAPQLVSWLLHPPSVTPPRVYNVCEVVQ
jgi:hypothetical protein